MQGPKVSRWSLDCKLLNFSITLSTCSQSCFTTGGAAGRSASHIVAQLGKYGAGAGSTTSGFIPNMAEQEGSNSSIIPTVRGRFIHIFEIPFDFLVMFYLSDGLRSRLAFGADMQ